MHADARQKEILQIVFISVFNHEQPEIYTKSSLFSFAACDAVCVRPWHGPPGLDTPLTQKAPATRKCFQSPILGRPAASDLRAYYGAVTACIPVFLPGAHSSRPASPQQPQPFPETTANHPLKTYCMWPVSHSQGETFGISFSSSEERHNSVVCETGSSHLTEQTQQVSSRGKNGTRYVIYANIW